MKKIGEASGISGMAKLYSLPWLGIGTRYSESLRSYWARLAFEHCVSPNKLYKKYIEPYYASEGRRGKYFRHWPAFSLSRTIEAVFLAERLAELTRVLAIPQAALHRLVVLLAERRLARGKARYCPLCWQGELDDMYSPVLWEFLLVKACPIHQVRLMPVECGAPVDERLTYHQMILRPGICGRCGATGMECAADRPVFEATAMEVRTAEEVGDLVAMVSDGYPVSRELLVQGMHACIAMRGSAAALAQALGMDGNALRSRMFAPKTARNGPSLEVLVAVAAELEISLVSIFRGAPCRAPAWPDPFDVPRNTHHAARSLPGFLERMQSLEGDYEFIASSPQSARALAESLGITPSYMSNNYPRLWKAAVAAHRRYRQERTEVRFARFRSSVKKAILDLQGSGIPVTYAAVARRLSIFVTEGVYGKIAEEEISKAQK